MCTYITFIYGSKKSKSENHIKLDPIRCQMMGGLQIWSQNSNQILFDSAFVPKLSKTGQIGYLANFDSFPKQGSNVIRI